MNYKTEAIGFPLILVDDKEVVFCPNKTQLVVLKKVESREEEMAFLQQLGDALMRNAVM